MKVEEVKVEFGREELIIKTGKLAKQAGGSVTVQCGGTMVLVTCVCSRQARENAGFFPLTVEYREKTFAAGRIPGGFFKREGRPTEKEILTSRMIDRPIRPLFPEGMLNEVQVIATVLSSDGKNDSDVLALIGASAALTISDIPFNGPIGGVRVGLTDDRFIVNPTFEELEESKLDLVVVANEESVIMLEAGADRISEDKMMEGIKAAQDPLNSLIDIQKQLREKTGKPKRENITFVEINEEIYRAVREKAPEKLKEIFQLSEKQQRVEYLELLKKQLVEDQVPEDSEDVEADVRSALAKVEKETVRDFILKKKKRVDGRKFDEIRPLCSEIDILPRTHGSGLFTRGETQALAVITLGTGSDEQRIETLRGEGVKTFMLHYNFPPFSVGETKPMRGPGRREIGHGALAEKALKPVLPLREGFPYTIRIVSEILESNGSSSMATVCASSLSLMASGVPITDAVSGIAMGMVKDGDDYAILTDIAGAEDHYGDMDFKVAGTKGGITAVQMDLKIRGISHQILEEAFDRARKARLEIMENMNKTIDKPLKEIAPNAPRIVTVMVKVDRIRDVIGPGGKMIRKIIAETGADINIEDDGACQIASADKESLDKAVDWIKGITAEPEIGKVYDARITKIMNFGAFCEFLPGQEGLIHVSELSAGYVKEVTDVVKEGQEVKVKLIGIDDQNRVKLSIKQAE
ncbi:MAG: polyribonucleotide nucleotidyltransferase [Candidatus Makaraimicrobium thalassicum]|nr:MAG: polyribonucleotide nucleotidyltransferase [Candidatus Omnitrophota bacterium]